MLTQGSQAPSPYTPTTWFPVLYQPPSIFLHICLCNHTITLVHSNPGQFPNAICLWSCGGNNKQECTGARARRWMLACIFHMQHTRHDSHLNSKNFHFTVQDFSVELTQFLYIFPSPRHSSYIYLIILRCFFSLPPQKPASRA